MRAFQWQNGPGACTCSEAQPRRHSRIAHHAAAGCNMADWRKRELMDNNHAAGGRAGEWATSRAQSASCQLPMPRDERRRGGTGGTDGGLAPGLGRLVPVLARLGKQTAAGRTQAPFLSESLTVHPCTALHSVSSCCSCPQCAAGLCASNPTARQPACEPRLLIPSPARRPPLPPSAPRPFKHCPRPRPPPAASLHCTTARAICPSHPPSVPAHTDLRPSSPPRQPFAQSVAPFGPPPARSVPRSRPRRHPQQHDDDPNPQPSGTATRTTSGTRHVGH